MKGDHVVSFCLLPARLGLFRRDPIWSLAAAAGRLVVDARLRRSHSAHIAGVFGAAEHLLGLSRRWRAVARRCGRGDGVPESRFLWIALAAGRGEGVPAR